MQVTPLILLTSAIPLGSASGASPSWFLTAAVTAEMLLTSPWCSPWTSSSHRTGSLAPWDGTSSSTTTTDHVCIWNKIRLPCSPWNFEIKLHCTQCFLPEGLWDLQTLPLGWEHQGPEALLKKPRCASCGLNWWCPRPWKEHNNTDGYKASHPCYFSFLNIRNSTGGGGRFCCSNLLICY